MQLTIKPASSDDVATIQSFIKDVFDDAVAPTYSNQGNLEFYKYIDQDAINKRFNNDHWILKAEADNKLLGIIEIRKNEHLSMMFVDSNHQRKGVGRKLLVKAIKKIRESMPQQLTLSVHSSPNATLAYEKLGFEKMSDEKIVNGIRFVTMEKKIS